jgi:hypothetical protein
VYPSLRSLISEDCRFSLFKADSLLKGDIIGEYHAKLCGLFWGRQPRSGRATPLVACLFLIYTADENNKIVELENKFITASAWDNNLHKPLFDSPSAPPPDDTLAYSDWLASLHIDESAEPQKYLALRSIPIGSYITCTFALNRNGHGVLRDWIV